MGLLLNSINSLTMLGMIHEMDERGKKLNAAYAVSGAYVIGGQMVVVMSIGSSRVFNAFLVSKLVSGIVAVIIAMRASDKGGNGWNKRNLTH